MLKNIISKVKNYLLSSTKFKREIDDIKVQNGIIFSGHIDQKLDKIKDLKETFFKVFSQNYEDGIIDYLIKSLKIDNLKFVEIGTQDYSESNTRFLYERYSCDGLIIDGYNNLNREVKKLLKLWKGNLKIHNDYIESSNIVSVLNKNGFGKDLDLFSIDIDGIDYWIIKELKPKISKIFVAEYNPYFGPKLQITVPNIKKFNRADYHKSHLCWGLSLNALVQIMKQKGYTLVGVNDTKTNAFFVVNEFLNLISLNLPDTNNLNVMKKLTTAKYRDSRDSNRRLNYIAPENILKEIEDCKVIDIANEGKETLLKDLL